MGDPGHSEVEVWMHACFTASRGTVLEVRHTGSRYLLRALGLGVQASGSGMTLGSCLDDLRGAVTGVVGRL
jgi:hypothetical protein